MAFVQEFVATQRAPLRVWLGPGVRAQCESLLREHLGGEVELRGLPGVGESQEGPAVLLLASKDLGGPHREPLLQAAKAALPGRPIVLYGASRKEVLLDAINTWHAFRLLPADVPQTAVVDAVRGAHQAMALELAIQLGAEQLHHECRRLQGAVEELRATQERLLHAERLTTVGRIVRTLTRHAQQHLATLEGFKIAQLKLPVDAALAEDLQSAAEGIDGFATLLRDMLALTEDRAAQAELRPEPLDPLVQRAVHLFNYDPLARGRSVSSLCQSNVTVYADRPRVVHVVLNLLRNAAQATEEAGRIEVRTNVEGGAGVVEIRDDGPGMPLEVQEQVFTPFFTTKGRAGMGLGLRLSRAAIEAHNGRLDCTSVRGEGTCFRIELPVAE